MTFLGDEGRDSLVWFRMVHNAKFTLIGPQTSIGNMYLGPLYYYLMLPFFMLLGTIGPSVGVALFAGVTTFMLGVFGKEWFSGKVGLLSSFLYAISPVAIILSHSSWNPNVMPFFSLLVIWGVWQFWQKERFMWLSICGVLISFAVQSHYLGLLLIPIVSLFWFVSLVRLIRNKDKKLKPFLFHSVFCIWFFVLLSIMPLVWFDLRHNFINYKAFYKFFSDRQATINLKAYKAVPELWPLWKMIFSRLIAVKNEFLGFWMSLATLLASVPIFYLIFKSKTSTKILKAGTLLLLSWMFFGFIGMGLYKQHIYDHYFGFLFPAIFLFFSLVLEKLWMHRIYFKLSAGALLVTTVFLSFSNSSLKESPNSQMKHTSEVAKLIIDESNGRPFNLGLIAKQNYDAGYRYFLEKSGHEAVEIDPQLEKQTVTDQLFVVCEEMVCQPTTHPQAEIANFGWSKIEKEWTLPWGTKLFKLVHY